MTDSLIDKLQRMAAGGTPPEQEIARAKLQTMARGHPPEPEWTTADMMSDRMSVSWQNGVTSMAGAYRTANTASTSFGATFHTVGGET